VDYPRAGAHYPRSTGESLAWFRIDKDCLAWLGWPAGLPPRTEVGQPGGISPVRADNLFHGSDQQGCSLAARP
jgi:hypothetical protein